MSTHCIIINCGDGSSMLTFFNSEEEAIEYIESEEGSDRLDCDTEIYEIAKLSNYMPLIKWPCGHWSTSNCWRCN